MSDKKGLTRTVWARKWAPFGPGEGIMAPPGDSLQGGLLGDGEVKEEKGEDG